MRLSHRPSRFVVQALLGIGLAAPLFVYIVWPLYRSSRPVPAHTKCLGHLKQLGLAALMYAQDHNERMPDRAWGDALLPYVRYRSLFMCPGQPPGSHYAFNAAVAGKRLEPDPVLPLLFDSNVGPNSRGGRELIVYPHHGAANLVASDGHVLRAVRTARSSGG
ncbi:MAG: hypothetical protein FJX72_04330, partial [Armatimonadetes bacterium]|nr:hypothetical protein [Armatimonadota bacterium]